MCQVKVKVGSIAGFVRVRGAVADADACRKIEQAIAHVKATPIPWIVLDLRPVTRVSATALTVLAAEGAKWTNGANGTALTTPPSTPTTRGGFAVVGPNSSLPVHAVFRITRILPCFETPEEALLALYRSAIGATRVVRESA